MINGKDLLDAVTKLAAIDKRLEELISKVGPITLQPQPMQTAYEALIESVVYQQLTGKAAATILGRVKALYPNKTIPEPIDLLNTPQELLRTAGLSAAKSLALKDIAAKAMDGTIPSNQILQSMSDIDIIEQLTTIRGVGQWTVEMMLIFKLGRPDVLPVADLGVRKGFALTYGHRELPSPKTLLAFGEQWRPYRTTAAWYFWRALELPKNNGLNGISGANVN